MKIYELTSVVIMNTYMNHIHVSTTSATTGNCLNINLMKYINKSYNKSILHRQQMITNRT